MLDLKYFRENVDAIKEGVAKKKFDVDIDAIIELDTTRRTAVSDAETWRAKQKAANAEMAKMKKGSPEFLEKVKEMKELSAKVKELQAVADKADEEFKASFITIPNVPHESVPFGKTEDENVVTYTWGDPEAELPFAKAHYDISWFEKYVDLKSGSKVTGAGFPFYIGDMARMVRALIQLWLDENDAAGFVEVMPPIVVNPQSGIAVGQLPDKEGQMYYVGEDDLYLIPTAETSVTNLYRDITFNADQLPVYHTAYTPCFRREAGSYGKDVRGLNRLHQFDKVELLKWVNPDTSFEELESLRKHVESLVKKLELPFRTLSMCSGDIGFSHAKQYDIEVFAAGQKRWLEVSSCSCFTDFQARRANIRYRGEDGKPKFVHTLNGSGLAVPRILAAILENYLQEDGRVKVPEVLRERMGKDFIGG